MAILEPFELAKQTLNCAESVHLQIEAIKQVRYFNRVILLTVITCVLFFAMSILVGIDAMAMGTG